MATIKIKDISESKMVKLVDLSEDSINKIAEAVVQKIAESVKHGHWVEDKERPWRWICSECDTYMSNEIDRNMDMNYCPNCGAKMDEVTK